MHPRGDTKKVCFVYALHVCCLGICNTFHIRNDLHGRAVNSRLDNTSDGAHLTCICY
jgi:hypothetical protein